MPEELVEGKPSHVGADHQLPPPPHLKPARSLTVRILIWLLILLAFGILFWVVWRHKAASAAPSGRRAAAGGTVTLNTATATTGNIGVYLQSIGTVTPVHTDTITSQASGLISQVNYREGQLVRQGQLLIEIDPRPYQAAVLTAQGALERDQGLLAQAKMDLERYQAAWARNAIAKQQLDDQEKIVMQDEGTVKSDQGTLQMDQVNLTYCYIKAPISGRVGLRLVDPGNVVQSTGTTPLVVITQLQPITVVFTIPEDSVGQVQEQIHAGKTLAVDAFDRTETTKLASGKLLTLDNQIDTTTGTLKLRAVFSNSNYALFPNLFVNTRLLVKTLTGVTLLPSYAIQHNGDVAFVFLIQNGIAHMHNITEGITDKGMTQVQGLSPGAVVAGSGFERLTDGSKVTVTKQAILPSTTSGTPAP